MKKLTRFRSNIFHMMTSPAAMLCLLGATLFSSCIKDDFDFEKMQDMEWSPELAAPLVNTSMTFKDILDNNTEFHVEMDQDNFCTFMYSDTLYTLKASEILSIKDQDVKYLFSMDSLQKTTFNLLGTLSHNDVQHISFKPDNHAEVDSIQFKHGRLKMDLTSTFTQNVEIQVSMPGLKKNGASFSRIFNLNYQGSAPVSSNLNLDVDGYMLDITNNGTAVNDLTVNYKIVITGSGTPASGNEDLILDAKFEDLEFRSVYGYFGNQVYASNLDTLPFNFFNSQPGVGTFTLANPKLKVTLVNSVGIPVHATIPTFDAYSSAGQVQVNAGIPNPLPVFSPSVAQAGQSLSGSFELNNANSNLVSVISHIPEYFVYQVSMQTNPNGDQTQNFITDSSWLSIHAAVELPLYGSAKDFVITDTTDFKLDDIDQIEKLTMRTNLTNGFPIDVSVQVYFTDENYNVIDSLLSSGTEVLKSAVVHPITGKAIGKTEKRTDVVLTAEQIKKLTGAKKVITRAQAATTNNGNTNVRIYADYAFGVRIGAIAKVKVMQ